MLNWINNFASSKEKMEYQTTFARKRSKSRTPEGSLRELSHHQHN